MAFSTPWQSAHAHLEGVGSSSNVPNSQLQVADPGAQVPIIRSPVPVPSPATQMLPQYSLALHTIHISPQMHGKETG